MLFSRNSASRTSAPRDTTNSAAIAIAASFQRTDGMLPSGRVTTGTFGLRTFRQPVFRRIVIFTILAIVGAFRVAQLWILASERMWAYDFSYFWTAAGHLLRGEPLYAAALVAGTYVEDSQPGFLYPPP